MLLDLVIQRDSHVVSNLEGVVEEGNAIVSSAALLRQPRATIDGPVVILAGGSVLLAGTVIRRPRSSITFGVTPGGGSVDLVLNEVPAGTINGSNVIFTTTYNFAELLVYLNGLRLKNTDDYFVTGGNEFSLAYAPRVGDTLLVDYLR